MVLVEDPVGKEAALLRFTTGRFGVGPFKYADIVYAMNVGGFDVLSAESEQPFDVNDPNNAASGYFYLIRR